MVCGTVNEKHYSLKAFPKLFLSPSSLMLSDFRLPRATRFLLLPPLALPSLIPTMSGVSLSQLAKLTQEAVIY
jgi:hypothetical protein